MHSTTQIRVLGSMLILIGAVLLLAATMASLWVYRAIHHIGDTQWDGSPRQTQMVYSVLAVIGIAGSISGFVGIWHMMTGRLNKPLLGFAAVAGIILFVIVKIVPRIA